MKRLIPIILLALLSSNCTPIRPPMDIPKHPPAPRDIEQNLDVAIALGSGGAKGYAHLGVLNVLADAGIPINLIAGSSAGSLVGALYADHGSVNQAYHAMMPAGLWAFADIDTTPNQMGFVSGHKLEQFLFNNMEGRTFKDLKIPLLIATTNMLTGKAYLIRSGPIPPAVDASASVPGLVVPTKLYGKMLIDGGVANPVPVDILQPFHPKMIIAVDISASLPKDPPSSALKVYHRAYDIMWIELTKISRKQADVIIHPHIGADVSMFAITKKCLLYKRGQEAATKALPDILKIMEERGIKRLKVNHPSISGNTFCQSE